MVRRLKYKIVNTHGRTVHHSYNKQNAQKWVRMYGKGRQYYIKKME